MTFFRKHIVLTNIAIVIVGVNFAVIVWRSGDWFFAGSVQTFGPLNNYAFICLSLVIAAIAALNSVFATTIASDTGRPFLNVSRISAQFNGDGINPSPIRYFMVGVDNTGNYPADQVSITLEIWKTTDNNKHKLILDGEETPIYFPNVGNPNLRFLETNDNNTLTTNVGEKLHTKIEVAYYNKLKQSKHRTIRSYWTEYNNTANHEPTPIPAEDYWD